MSILNNLHTEFKEEVGYKVDIQHAFCRGIIVMIGRGDNNVRNESSKSSLSLYYNMIRLHIQNVS